MLPCIEICLDGVFREGTGATLVRNLRYNVTDPAWIMPEQAGDGFSAEEQQGKGTKNVVQHRPPPPPIASLFLARWFDYWSDPRRSEYKITQNWPTKALIDVAGVKSCFGARFEVYQLYVRNENSLRNLDVNALTRAMAPAKYKAAFYYLWPTQKQLEGRWNEPNQVTGVTISAPPVASPAATLSSAGSCVTPLASTADAVAQPKNDGQEKMVETATASSNSSNKRSRKDHKSKTTNSGPSSSIELHLLPSSTTQTPESEEDGTTPSNGEASTSSTSMPEQEDSSTENSSASAPACSVEQLPLAQARIVSPAGTATSQQSAEAAVVTSEEQSTRVEQDIVNDNDVSTSSAPADVIANESTVWPLRSHNDAGMIQERAFFDFVERLESASIPTRYPAPAKLYRQLCGKMYYNAACINPSLKTPVTVSVQASDVRENPLKAARSCLKSLNSIRKKVWGEGFNGVNNDNAAYPFVNSGVVKLGFSWMGVDVQRWDGVEELAEKLKFFCDGDPRWIGTNVIVQELVPDRVCELRVHAFSVPPEARVDMKGLRVSSTKTNDAEDISDMKIQLMKTDDDQSSSTNPKDETASSSHLPSSLPPLQHTGEQETEFDLKIAYLGLTSSSATTSKEFQMTGHIPFTPRDALATVWQGDETLQKEMEDEAKRLTEKWLAWYESEWGEYLCPANARFDFHVRQRDKGKNDKQIKPQFELWICEITECGASLVGLPIEARNTAIVNSLLATSSCSSEQISPLPWPSGDWSQFYGEHEGNHINGHFSSWLHPSISRVHVSLL
eukprot:GSA25T00020607001.1